MHSARFVAISCLIFGFAGTARAADDKDDVKKSAKELWKDVKSGAQDVGRELKEAGQEVGHDIATGAKAAGHEIAGAAQLAWYKGKKVSAPLLHDLQTAVHQFWDKVIADKDAAIKRLREENEQLKRKLRDKESSR